MDARSASRNPKVPPASCRMEVATGRSDALARAHQGSSSHRIGPGPRNYHASHAHFDPSCGRAGLSLHKVATNTTQTSIESGRPYVDVPVMHPSPLRCTVLNRDELAGGGVGLIDECVITTLCTCIGHGPRRGDGLIEPEKGPGASLGLYIRSHGTAVMRRQFGSIASVPANRPEGPRRSLEVRDAS